MVGTPCTLCPAAGNPGSQVGPLKGVGDLECRHPLLCSSRASVSGNREVGEGES